jgi:hypothetical protein
MSLMTETMDQRQPARLILRVQDLHQFLQPLGAHCGAHLDADRIGDAAKIFDVRAVDVRRAHADPRHVRRQVVPALLALDVARLRLFEEQMQPFVTGVEIPRVAACTRCPLMDSKNSSDSAMESTIF